jgi:hypothetical protein
VPFSEESRPGDWIELGVSDPVQLAQLRDWLRSQPDIVVGLASPTSGPGELGMLGMLDVVTVLASSGGVVAAIKTLPDFIRSRSRKIRIEATVRDRRFVLEATNVDDVVSVLERLLDD